MEQQAQVHIHTHQYTRRPPGLKNSSNSVSGLLCNPRADCDFEETLCLTHLHLLPEHLAAFVFVGLCEHMTAWSVCTAWTGIWDTMKGQSCDKAFQVFQGLSLSNVTAHKHTLSPHVHWLFLPQCIKSNTLQWGLKVTATLHMLTFSADIHRLVWCRFISL